MAWFDYDGRRKVAPEYSQSIQIPVLDALVSNSKSSQAAFLLSSEQKKAAAEAAEAAAKKDENWNAAKEAKCASAAADAEAGVQLSKFDAEQAALEVRLSKSREWLQALKAKAAAIEACKAPAEAEIEVRKAVGVAGVEERKLALEIEASEAEAAREAHTEALGTKRAVLLAQGDYDGLIGVDAELAAVQRECDEAKAADDAVRLEYNSGTKGPRCYHIGRAAVGAAREMAIVSATASEELEAAMKKLDMELRPLHGMIEHLEVTNTSWGDCQCRFQNSSHSFKTEDMQDTAQQANFGSNCPECAGEKAAAEMKAAAAERAAAEKAAEKQAEEERVAAAARKKAEEERVAAAKRKRGECGYEFWAFGVSRIGSCALANSCD
jgi:hypothetical protein